MTPPDAGRVPSAWIERAGGDLLTDYATSTRYPGDAEPPSREEAVRAIDLARTVRDFVQARLS